MSEYDERVRYLHQRAVEATNSGRPAVGARLLRSALRMLDWPQIKASPEGWQDWPGMVTRVLVSLAGAEVVLGNSVQGFALLDAAEAVIGPDGRAVLLQQRGLALVLVGKMGDALICLDEALPLLRQGDDMVVLARALLNRAMLHQIAGRVRPAMADLDECARIGAACGTDDGMPRTVAKALHGRGQCRVLTGDIPAAMRDFDAEGTVYAEHGPGMLPPLAVDKARALLAAGLPTEAAAVLDTALSRFPRSGMDQEHAEAELTRALAALAVADHGGARGWAVRAERRFRRRGNDTWAAVAALTRLWADLGAGWRLSAVAFGASALTQRLRELGLRNDADTALLLAARANIALGRLNVARTQLASRERQAAPPATRLLRRLALAELAAADGDRRAVLSHARTGLALLRSQWARMGSIDLRTGTAALGGELARAGLAAALETGDPRTIFRWLERSRAQAFRARPVHRPADEHTADAVAELRFLAKEMRAAELTGRRLPEARGRCAELERRIRAKDWQADGDGTGHPEASYAETCAALSEIDSVMVSFLLDGSRVRALLVRDGRACLVGSADLSVVSEALVRLRADLDAMCGRHLPRRLEQVIQDSARRQLGTLAAELITPLEGLLGDRDVIITPTGALSAVPWGLVPGLRGRPVTITPSPSAWLGARRTPPTGATGVLLVAGPGLSLAQAEITSLTTIYPDGVVLADQRATVAATLRHIQGSAIAHFAAHGHHEQENMLFSRLDLLDGPLMAYDIQQLPAVPQHVVLSACDMGRSIVRPGDEIIGFTAALLYSGSRTVVSSVARVDDQAAATVMVAYHRALADGITPARALADAIGGEALVPFVCFGDGNASAST